MSTRGLKRPTTRGCTRDTRRRKMVLDVDLNVDPPIESRVPEGASSLHGNPDDGHVGRQDAASSSVGGRIDNALIDVEALEDEVVIFSPRSSRESFCIALSPCVGYGLACLKEEDVKKKMFLLGTTLEGTLQRLSYLMKIQMFNLYNQEIDEDVVLRGSSKIEEMEKGMTTWSGSSVAEEPVTRLALNSYYSHSRNSTSETIINCELYIEGRLNGRRLNAGRHHVEERNKARTVTNSILDLESQTVAPPKEEPTFSCAVCMGPLVEATSTICGHIFCKGCIKAAIAAQKKCPACRRKLCANNIHRIYLPAIN
ncbi:hypothetical protein ACLOJK_001742 [Asimina triloba]